MDLSSIPSWCLYDTISTLDPSTIANLAQTSENMADVCTSQTLWKEIYHLRFPPSKFRLTNQQYSANWMNMFSKRYAIVTNIANEKPKVKSFHEKSSITHLRTLTNAFAYSTSNQISLVIYDYFDNECKYEQTRTFNVSSTDFLFMDSNSIITVDPNNVTLIDIETSQMQSFDVEVGRNPSIHSVSPNLFAVVSNGESFIYDVREGCDKKCKFTHKGDIKCLASEGTTLYIASSKDLTAHDVRNPRGPIIWNSVNLDNPEFCSINIPYKKALFGTHVVDMATGRLIANTNINQTVCGSIIDKNICVTGCKHRAVVFYDYNNKKEVVGSIQFGVDEEIRSICSSTLNGKVAIAGSFTVRLFDTSYKDNEFSASIIKTVQCGSVRQRKQGEGLVQDVIFDGERLITNMDTFVRVYDFYTGKNK